MKGKRYCPSWDVQRQGCAASKATDSAKVGLARPYVHSNCDLRKQLFSSIVMEPSGTWTCVEHKFDEVCAPLRIFGGVRELTVEKMEPSVAPALMSSGEHDYHLCCCRD